MGSTAAPNNAALCGGCRKPSSEFVELDSDQLCRSCEAVLWAAMVLWEENITAEDEVIPTLVYARKMGSKRGSNVLTPDPMIAHYPSMEVVRRIRGGVPIVRVLPLVVGGETHANAQVLERVHIQVLSKHVEAARVSEEYERVVTEHGARWERNNHGRFSYAGLVGPILQFSIEAGRELTPERVEGLGGDSFSHPAWHFPSPDLVASVYKALLNSAWGHASTSFKKALDLYGKAQPKTPERLIPAFVAWHLGAQTEPNAGETVCPEARPRIARLLTRHLLDRCEDLRPIPDGSLCSGHVVWQDVAALWPRFVRLEALLPLT